MNPLAKLSPKDRTVALGVGTAIVLGTTLYYLWWKPKQAAAAALAPTIGPHPLSGAVRMNQPAPTVAPQVAGARALPILPRYR
jgi:hypothetical protein